MDLGNENVIGIVGGMGPRAGVALFDKVLHHTKAATDQHHLSVVMTSFPRHISDRTMFLEGNSNINPAYAIAEVVEKLESVGAKVIGMACNTAHAPKIYDIIMEELERRRINVHFLHMPLETCRHLAESHNGIRRVGIMSTNGTYNTQIYESLLLGMNYDVIVPDPTFQNDVIHRIIYDKDFGIKANPEIGPEVMKLVDDAITYFECMNADAIILGCTELSLALKEEQVRGMTIVDSTDCLARAMVIKAMEGRYSPMV